MTHSPMWPACVGLHGYVAHTIQISLGHNLTRLWAHTPVWPTRPKLSSPCLAHGLASPYTVVSCALVTRARPSSSITRQCSVTRPTTRATTRLCGVDRLFFGFF
ncbi:hypothetical protein F383_25276 [Gossypium arboreum]|uniref:Uncharacterized protein n=1 Tax=Gossypium arboreum TaxID=29729 RepID=A0A0B0NX68_GOSAR|nr:hypothetical protein F383_25276 [Gossypium arboreum]